jgi:hypothetical protein
MHTSILVLGQVVATVVENVQLRFPAPHPWDAISDRLIS